MNRISRALAVTAILSAVLTTPLLTQAQSAASGDKPFVVEYYYKARWGYADEFLKLFKKNHYPLLKKEVEMGRMLKVWMDQPRYHTHRRRPLGLSRHHRLQERHRRQRVFRRRRPQEATLSRPGSLPARRATPLHDSRGALGSAGQNGRSRQMKNQRIVRSITELVLGVVSNVNRSRAC